MPTIKDEVRGAMTSGGNLDLEFDPELNDKNSGLLDVYLHKENETEVRVDLNNTGELAKVLWLPWKQGDLRTLRPEVIEPGNLNDLFLTYRLTGCKVFAICGGPVWHIDAEVTVKEFWKYIVNDEWVEDNWQLNDSRQVAYLHRAGQPTSLWDLSECLNGPPPTTYGSENVGQAVVGGVVNASKQLDLYFKSNYKSEPSCWTTLNYTEQKRKS